MGWMIGRCPHSVYVAGGGKTPMRIDPLRDAGPVRTLEQAIDRDCRDMRGSLTAVCAILNEPYDAFQKRLSVSYPSHHLHAPDVERVIELVRGDAVRQY